MSGGHFEYRQFHIRCIYEEIAHVLEIQGQIKPKNELWCGRDYYEKYPEELHYPILSDNVNKIYKDAIEILKLAEIYAQRIDWFISGDDGEESFIRRLNDEIQALKNTNLENWNCP